MGFKTADLCDSHADIRVADPIFQAYGKAKRFFGPIKTVKVYEDNVLVRQALESDGQSRVLVVDGGGSTRCALVGDRLAQLAIDNNWAGIVVYGCIRDSADINDMPVGILAIGTCPKKSIKRGHGETDITLRFAGTYFEPNHHLYADEDGVIVAPRFLI